MITANTLISGALRVVTTVSPGEPIPGEEASNALDVLNAMLAGWSAESLMIPFRTLESFPFVIGKNSYTIGPTGDLVTVRPDSITGLYRRDSNNQDFPLTSGTQQQYNAIGTKGLGGSPDSYFYDPQFPNGVLYIYPAPSVVQTLFVESLKPINQFSTLQAALSLPGEYQEAIKYLLAERLAPEYGMPISADVRKLIEDSRRRLMRKNSRPRVAALDAVYARPSFDIRTG